MELLDTVACQRQCVERPRLAASAAAVISCSVTRKPARSRSNDRTSRVVVQRLVAARGHVGDDSSNRHLDVRRRLAFGVEEGAESFSKIGGACVETDGHVYLARCERGCYSQRVGCNASRKPRSVIERLRGKGDAYQVSFLITILILRPRCAFSLTRVGPFTNSFHIPGLHDRSERALGGHDKKCKCAIRFGGARVSVRHRPPAPSAPMTQ